MIFVRCAPSGMLPTGKSEPAGTIRKKSLNARYWTRRIGRRMGPAFVLALQEETRSAINELGRAWSMACKVCDAENLWRQTAQLNPLALAERGPAISALVCAMVERVTRWRLNNRQPLAAISPLIEHYINSVRLILAQQTARASRPAASQSAPMDVLALLDEASRTAPQAISIHLALALEKRARGDEAGAGVHLVAAQAIESRTAPALRVLCDAAARYFQRGDDPNAVRWYLLALTLDPQIALAWQNLAAIYARNGHPEEAGACRMRAYQIQRIFIESCPHAARRLLILYSGHTTGNVPLDYLLQNGRSCRIKYAIDCAAPGEDQDLPPFDLVFNAIGDPDVAMGLADRVEGFRQRCAQPVLNPPDKVVRTRRHQMAALLTGLDDVVLAPCLHLDPSVLSAPVLARLLDDAQIGFPLLVRPEATHGGQGLERCENLEALMAVLALASGPQYVMAFIDYATRDGFFRKYRMIFIDRAPFPYHLAISRHWMVHYHSSAMETHPWKLEEEHRFLRDPASVLGARALSAIRALGRRLDLDYAGVDFSMLPDGRVLVFEANATMLVHGEPDDGVLAHKNAYVRRIADAFEQLQASRVPCGG